MDDELGNSPVISVNLTGLIPAIRTWELSDLDSYPLSWYHSPELPNR